MSFSKYVTGLIGGAFEGAKVGVLHMLNTENDDRVRAMLYGGLKQIYEKVDLEPDRKKRLLLLLSEALSKLQSELK